MTPFISDDDKSKTTFLWKAKLEGEGISVVLPLLREMGGWPTLGTHEGGNWREGNFSLATLVATINKYSNVPYIFPYVFVDSKDKTRRLLHVGITCVQDFRDTEKFISDMKLLVYSISILQLDNPGFILPEGDHYNQPKNSPLMRAYIDLGVKVAVEFGANEEQARKDMEDILDLEIQLVNVRTKTTKSSFKALNDLNNL